MKKNVIAASCALVCASVFGLDANAATQFGTFAPGETVTAPQQQSPVNTSRMFVRVVTPTKADTSVDIPVTGTGSLIIWTVPMATMPAARKAGDEPGAAPKTTLRAPSGAELDAGSSQNEAAAMRRFTINDFASEEFGLDVSRTQEVIHIATAEAGLYQLNLSGAGEGTAYAVLAAEPDSSLSLETWAAPLSRRAGEPLTLHARLTDELTAVRGRVTARIAPEGGVAAGSIELHDDGQHGDGEAGDGHFAASLSRLPKETAGMWSVKFDASGLRGETAFLRTGSAGFANEPDMARIVNVTAVPVAREDAGRSLRVTVQADVKMEGKYRLDIIVAGQKNADESRLGVAWAEMSEQLTPGVKTLTVDIPWNLVRKDARSGLHVDVRLLGLDPMGVAGRTEIDLPRLERDVFQSAD